MDPAALALRHRLLSRIQRRFQTVSESIPIGPLRIPFTRIANPDTVLDQIVEAEDLREKLSGERRQGDELHLPYWAELWDSAIGMSAYLADHPLTPSPRHPVTVLDLGCGMGLTSAVAAAMGANVLMADLEPDALLFARLNTATWWRQVRARRVNWRTDRLKETFDLIIGADVLYDRTQWEFLDAFFRSHLSPKGSVLLGEPGRQTGDLFPAWIEQRDWALTFIDQRIPTREKPIRVFQLKRT